MESEFREDQAKKAMMYLLKERQNAQDLSLDRQSLPSGSEELEKGIIKVGSFYEVDHSKLSPKSPDQLYSIRIVMVHDEVSQSVSLRYPSVHSLRTHFSKESYDKSSHGKKFPALDEKYVMSSDTASKVLLRRIPPHEMAERGRFWSFWSPPSKLSEKNNESDDGVSKRGSCSSRLRFDGMVQWGRRRQVRFLNRHEEYVLHGTSASPSVDSEKKSTEDVDEDEEEDNDDDHGEEEEDDEEEEEEELAEEVKEGVNEQQEEEEEEEEEEETFKAVVTRRSSKRKIPPSKSGNSKTGNKRKKQSPPGTKKTFFRNSIERWSAARYKLAEENMLKIMKAKGAFFGNPILRPALRAEARKLIGDTGLLDHLLKHMAGKLAPGGTERFRRRHNSDGAMEYWIENADLVNIRKQAGVQDPYWTPPPGWKPGDNPLQDPISAKEIESLKNEMAKMKKRVEELSFSRETMAIHSNDILTSGQISDCENQPLLLKMMYKELMNYKSKIEEKLMEFSGCLNAMKEKERTRMLKSGEIIMSDSELPPPPPTTTTTLPLGLLSIGSPLQILAPQDSDQTEVSNDNNYNNNNKGQTTIEDRKSEEKARKIERLKSGFRICKPQGSFLWPTNTNITDPFLVPTPPSASSTSAPPGSLPLALPPLSPVKPLAEKRPIKPTTLFFNSGCSSSSNSVPPQPKTPNSQTVNLLINLNEAPNELNTDDVSLAEKGKENLGKCCEDENQL